MALTDRDLETKAMHFEGVSLDEHEGIIEGFSAVMGNVDSIGDRIQPGAFDRTIAERKAKIPMGLDHMHGFGVTLDMEEVPRSALPSTVLARAPEAKAGMWARGQVMMTDENAKLLEGLRSLPQPPGMSFTYRSVRSETKASARGEIRDLLEIALNEWGPTPGLLDPGLRSINSAAVVTEMKAGSEAGTETEDTPSIEQLDELDLWAFVERCDVELKAGRVLSRKNFAALDAAISALQSIRDAANSTDDEAADTATEALETLAGEGTSSKAANDARPEDVESALWELDLLRTRAALIAAG